MQAQLLFPLPQAASNTCRLIFLPLLPAELEAEFLNNVAVRRRYVLMFIMCFDVLCYLFRLLAKYVKNKASETSEAGSVLSSLMPQLLNMAFLYVFLGLLNWRSRRLGNGAARQVNAVCHRLHSLLSTVLGQPCGTLRQ